MRQNSCTGRTGPDKTNRALQPRSLRQLPRLEQAARSSRGAGGRGSWFLWGCWFVIGLLPALVQAQEPPAGLTPAERGYWFILNKAYVTPEFDAETLDQIWRAWPASLRDQAQQASPETRRRLVFQRYGLTPRPNDPDGMPLQYTKTRNGGWAMNCFTCHGGEVAGQVIPGLPNSRIALQTITEESRRAKSVLKKQLNPSDVAKLLFPMGGTVGTTNAVMFGVALENFRDADMNVVPRFTPPQLIHHDMDAPPWWHFSKKQQLYADGFVEKSHRALMPFMLVRSNGQAEVRAAEADFKDIAAFLESVEPPPYPYAIDRELAGRGERVFLKNCAECHGTYGREPTYDPPTVPIEELGTDPVRLRALSETHRRNYGQSWLADYGERQTVTNPVGYMAPPLDGIWASAPYLHNGSVPTLWHLLHPEERPAIWKRAEDVTAYDQTRVGLPVETFPSLPPDLEPAEQRQYFRTSEFGKSAAGHDYPNALTPQEKQELLEYLKSL